MKAKHFHEEDEVVNVRNSIPDTDGLPRLRNANEDTLFIIFCFADEKQNKTL